MTMATEIKRAQGPDTPHAGGSATGTVKVQKTQPVTAAGKGGCC